MTKPRLSVGAATAAGCGVFKHRAFRLERTVARQVVSANIEPRKLLAVPNRRVVSPGSHTWRCSSSRQGTPHCFAGQANPVHIPSGASRRTRGKLTSLTHASNETHLSVGPGGHAFAASACTNPGRTGCRLAERQTCDSQGRNSSESLPLRAEGYGLRWLVRVA